LESFLPAWLKKVWNVGTGGDEEITMRGNAFFEAKQALAAGGQYDLNSADDMAQLDKDASHAAYWLSILRTAGQWLGPSRPTPEFKAKAIQGDVFVNQMMADYRKWQQEDYDTATFKFLDVYGEQFWPYLARKTATTPYDALGASTAFGKWEAKNNDLLRQYPEVAAYFAPFENQFDWQVYTRQIIEGKRKRQLSSYAFDEAQWFAANAQYRYAIRMGYSEEGLKNLKTSLLQQYPGYGRHPYDVNKLPRQIDKLQEIVTLSRLDGNPVAEGLRVYFDARDTVLARVKKSGKGLGTKANAEERVKLRNAAAAIIEEYPEFGRLYERVLSREIDE
jgi:hypothetical protein